MEAAEKTLIYQDDTGLHRKLLTDDKDKDKTGGKDHATETNSDESNYVDLDVKPDCPKTVKVTFTGVGNQLSVIKCDSSNQGEQERKSKIISSKDKQDTVPGLGSDEPQSETLTKLPNTDQDSENENQRQVELDPSDCSDNVCSESDELRYTDMYLNSKTESDDGASALLSDHCGSDTVEDESHYITTHEIQLTELDHDVDYDLGRGTCWEFEDDNLVYSFVDYASFESDDTQEGTLILEGRGQAKVQSNLGGTVVSTEQEESDLCDSDKCASSDESVCKNPSEDLSEGKIHLSIKTSSRAVNDPVNAFDNNFSEYKKHCGDKSNFSFVSPGASAGPLCDRAPYFIPAPGRQHLATKLRRKDINEYSSGASSSISELDDADKEVRNLTAKSFRSLACPYFDAINLSTSSESSVSEYGLNKWSAYVDWNYGNITRGGERSVIAHKTSRATLEMNKNVESKKHGKSVTGTKTPQNKTCALNKRITSQQASSSSKKIQVKDHVQPVQRGVTLNFRYNVESHETADSKCPKKARPNGATGAVLARSGYEMQYHHTDNLGDTHKRAIFASSLLKNVISKKMQFEQERKMERGEICDTSPCFQIKDPEVMRERSPGRGLQRQTSESGSGFTVNSADDQCPEVGKQSSCGDGEETKGSKAPDDSDKGQDELQKDSTIHSQSTSSNSLKEDDPEPVKQVEPPSVTGTQTAAKEGLDTSSMLSKLLFVPSCQLHSKEKNFSDLLRHTPDSVTPAASQKSEKELKASNNGNKEENGKGGKKPEIKICLRSVKENKGCTLNIANLLTPKISYNVNTFRTADDTRVPILSAADRVPNFTVRDIRDTKCKLQTPIYHVRDVRKLVKSSYRFVSLNNSGSKCSTAADKPEEKAKTEHVKHLLPSPIVIKCNSVKTNVKSEKTAAQKQAVTSENPQSESGPSASVANRAPPVITKQGCPDQSDIQTSQLVKQRQEKFAGETVERRNEAAAPKQDAVEKIKAAVKTMEQLYFFDKNEWKRKSQAPRPITGSHVLSLIAREEQGAEVPEAASTDSTPQSEMGRPHEDKRALNVIHVPYDSDAFKTQQSKTFTNKSVLHFGSKACVSVNSDSSSAFPLPPTVKSSTTPAAPLSVKIEEPRHCQVENGKVKISPTNPSVTQGCSDSENYLTIPGMAYTNEIKLSNPEHDSKEGNSNNSKVNAADLKAPEQKTSPLIMEYPGTSIYHHSTAATGPQKQQQVLCFSPYLPNVSPTPSTGEPAQQTQRKMLVDPTTGHYYLVDTPIKATSKRLFDPETGQYVDVPMPHSPAAPVTPVPLSVSPLALNPGGYAPTYMIYPGFISSPAIAAQTVLPQSPCYSEDAGGENIKKNISPQPESKTAGTESTYYSATGETSQAQLQLPVSLGLLTTRGSGRSSERKPVISITTQQGPRIIAPPSFDGTTMSFVVEHR